MKVLIDCNSINKINDLYEFEYIYVFDNESLETILNLNIRCINENYLNELEDDIDINLTDYNIECRKKANFDDVNWREIPPRKDYKIAIIIPNCNYEEWIEKCLTSILNQNYQNYEIIFVDDMSTDNSVNIAKQLLKPPHKVIELKQKRFNGGARNEAYLHVSDDVDYIWYVDSDDWITENALEKINNKLQYNPDVLFIRLAEYDGKKIKNQEMLNYKDKYDAMVGWSGSSCKVIKKQLATRQECLYNEGTLKEDRNQHYKICINMKSFAVLNKAVYIWNRTNTKSVTTVREKTYWGTSTIRHYADTKQLYLTYKGKDTRLDSILEERLEKIKQEILNGGDKQH